MVCPPIIKKRKFWQLSKKLRHRNPSRRGQLRQRRIAQSFLLVTRQGCTCRLPLCLHLNKQTRVSPEVHLNHAVAPRFTFLIFWYKNRNTTRRRREKRRKLFPARLWTFRRANKTKTAPLIDLLNYSSRQMLLIYITLCTWLFPNSALLRSWRIRKLNFANYNLPTCRTLICAFRNH